MENHNQSKKKFKAAVVNLDEIVKSQSRDIGNAKMTESKEDRSGNIFKKTWTRLWKHNIAEEYYKQKEISAAKKDILDNKNIYIGEKDFGFDDGNNSHKEATDAIIDRFLSEHEQEMLKQEERDSKVVINKQVNDKIKDLIKEYASGNISAEVFTAEKDRILSEDHSDFVSHEKMHADNLFEIANEIKDSIEQGEKLGEMDFDIEITLGKARESLNTEAKKTTFDKIFENTGGFGRSVAESAVLVGGVAGAYSLTKALTLGLGKKTAKWFGFGAGIIAGAAIETAKENTRLNRDRAQHSRENAKGMKFNESDMERRVEMGNCTYETRPAKEIISTLEQDYILLKSGEISHDQLRGALGNLAMVEALVSLGDSKKIDLIAYENPGKIEKDRKDIAQKRAEVKVLLRKSLNEQPPEFIQGQGFDDYFEKLTNVSASVLVEGDLSTKDKSFNKLKKNKLTRKFLQTTLIGGSLGFAFQEVGSFFSERDGVIEGAFSDDLHKDATALEAGRRSLFDDHPRLDHSGDFNKIEINGGNTMLAVPNGAHIVENTDGTFTLTRVIDGEILLDHQPLSFDEAHNLTQESQDLLQGKSIYPDCNLIQVSHEQHISASDYIEKHPELTHAVHRDFMGNNTEMYEDPNHPGHLLGADKNELKLDWGGNSQTGINTQGNYVFNVHRMTDTGSFRDDVSTAAHTKMKAGVLKVLFSVTKDTQHHVFEVPVDTDGNAIIEKNSEIAKMMFETDSQGHAVFTGQFAEVAHQTGIATDGGENMQILATHIGEGRPAEMIDTIPKPVTYIPLDVPGETDYEPPLPYPTAPRRPLERGEYEKQIDQLKSTIGRGYGYGYGYGNEGDFGLLDQRNYKTRFSKSILENQKLDLSKDDSPIVNEYIKKQDKKYLEELSSMIKDAPSMKDSIEVSITVPAYQEGKNLEKTIRNYAKLNNRSKFELVILENHPKSKKRDDSMEIIERMKKEFPDLNLVHLYKEFDEKPPIGKVRKYLVDAVLLRKQQAGITKSIALVSNDADLEDIKPNYATEIAKAFSKNPTLDAVGAKWDYTKNGFEKMPVLHATQRLWHYYDIIFRQKHANSPELIGRNSAFRSGIYAGIGGYNDQAKLAEDLEIGWMIKTARNNDANSVQYLNSAGLVSNPRRAVVAMLSDKNLVDQYGDFHINEDVRNASLEDLLKDKIDFDPERFKKEVQSIYDFHNKCSISKGGWIEDKVIEDTFSRSLGLMGIKFEKTGDTIKVLSIGKLEDRLNKIEKTEDFTKKETVNFDDEITKLQNERVTADARGFSNKVKEIDKKIAEVKKNKNSRLSESVPKIIAEREIATEPEIISAPEINTNSGIDSEPEIVEEKKETLDVKKEFKDQFVEIFSKISNKITEEIKLVDGNILLKIKLEGTGDDKKGSTVLDIVLSTDGNKIYLNKSKSRSSHTGNSPKIKIAELINKIPTKVKSILTKSAGKGFKNITITKKGIGYNKTK